MQGWLSSRRRTKARDVGKGKTGHSQNRRRTLSKSSGKGRSDRAFRRKGQRISGGDPQLNVMLRLTFGDGRESSEWIKSGMTAWDRECLDIMAVARLLCSLHMTAGHGPLHHLPAVHQARHRAGSYGRHGDESGRMTTLPQPRRRQSAAGPDKESKEDRYYGNQWSSPHTSLIVPI